MERPPPPPAAAAACRRLPPPGTAAACPRLLPPPAPVSCRRLLPPVTPPPGPVHVYKCDSATAKCNVVPDGTAGAASKQVCDKPAAGSTGTKGVDIVSCYISSDVVGARVRDDLL